MRYTITAFVAAAIASVNAYTQPVGDQPIGNPFKTPELNTQVPKGKPYEVTWEPTIDKAGTVTILLLHGPSSNAVPQYAIAEKIPNTGSFSWTPSADIDPENTHYGLQLIVDATGQYQYTPQFGISGSKSSGGQSTSETTEPTSSKADGYPVASSRPQEPSKATSVPEGYPTGPAPSATNVPPQPSASKTGPVYLTTTTQVTSCSTPSGTAPVASGTGAPVPPGNPGVPSAPAGTAPGAPGAPAPSGTGSVTGPAAGGQSGIATGAAGKTFVASGAAVVAAIFAFAL